jgi:hypothetical protein
VPRAADRFAEGNLTHSFARTHGCGRCFARSQPDADNLPSDAQLLPSGNVLVAGYDAPGRIDIINPHGRILWTYGPSSGPGSLAQPSLALALPNGTIAVTDDWHHRVVLISCASGKIVWQYGHDGVNGSDPRIPEQAGRARAAPLTTAIGASTVRRRTRPRSRTAGA